MTRRALTQPTDHARNRRQWRDLVAAVHATVEAPTPAAVEALAAMALKARDLWTTPAAYPRGLVAGPLWSLSLMFARQTEAGRRERVTPILLAVAGMMDELLDEVGAETPRHAAPPASVVGEAPARLPYRED